MSHPCFWAAILIISETETILEMQDDLLSYTVSGGFPGEKRPTILYYYVSYFCLVDFDITPTAAEQTCNAGILHNKLSIGIVGDIENDTETFS